MRTAVASITLASAAAVPAPLPALAAPSSPGIEDLIEAHKAALAKTSLACDVLEKCEDALSDDQWKNPILVPLAVSPDGKGVYAFCDLGICSRDEIEMQIRATHKALRQRLGGSKWLDRSFPDYAAAIDREIDASEARAMQALADAEASIAARPDFGVADAEEAWKTAKDEEFDARLAFSLHVPRDEREAALKRAYLAKAAPFREGWCEGGGFVMAILQSLCGPVGASAAASA